MASLMCSIRMRACDARLCARLSRPHWIAAHKRWLEKLAFFRLVKLCCGEVCHDPLRRDSTLHPCSVEELRRSHHVHPRRRASARISTRLLSRSQARTDARGPLLLPRSAPCIAHSAPARRPHARAMQLAGAMVRFGPSTQPRAHHEARPRAHCACSWRTSLPARLMWRSVAKTTAASSVAHSRPSRACAMAARAAPKAAHSSHSWRKRRCCEP